MLEFIGDLFLGKFQGGGGSVVIPDASNTVAGKIRIATDGEVATGTLENVGVNPKQLKDRGAEFEQTPFELQEDVLSSTAKRVIKSGTFFVFENGDVSIDGKTVLKENTVDGSVLDIYGDDNYVMFMYQTAVKVYTLEEDGTLTLARTFTITGTNTVFEGKISNANNNYCFPGRVDNVRGFYYIPLADLLDEEVDLTHVATTGGNADYVCKVVYWLNNYVVFHNATYDIQYKTMFYGTDIATVFSAGTQILLTANNVIKTAEVIDNKLVIIASSGAFGVLTELPTEHNSIGILNLVCPCTADIVKTIGDVFYFCDSTNGQYATTEDIAQTPVLAVDGEENPIVSYDIEVIGTNKVMTLNSDNVRWSGLVKIPILQSEVIDLSTTAITIANVVANTVYKYGTINSLAITAVEVSNRKSVIYFTTGATLDFTGFTAPANQLFIVGSAVVVAEKSYKITIENGIMNIQEYGLLS